MTITIESQGWTPPPWLNALMKGLLHTPGLQRIIGKSVALISFVGRKTGTRYTIPVSYARDGDSLIILSRASRTWWRNFDSNPDIELRLAGRVVEGRVTAHLADEGDLETIRAFLQKRPMDAKAYGLTVRSDGEISDEEARALIGRLAVIRVELDSQTH